MLKLPLGLSGQTVAFSDQVLEYLSRHRQIKAWQPEAGGQLFAKVTCAEILVGDITGPRKADRRFRFLYIPDRKLEQKEIDSRFGRELHYVGDWHTHPEPTAKPSPQDLQSMRDCVTKSRHQLNSFLLVIVGSLGVPSGLHISLHDGSEVVTLLGG